MKKEEVFAFLDAQGYDYKEKADPSLLRVMTSNVLFSHADKSVAYELDYKGRADILAGMYLYFQPDVIGLQEMTDDMKAALREHFSDVYAFVETPTGEKWKAGKWQNYRNYTPIVYNLYFEADGKIVDSTFL